MSDANETPKASETNQRLPTAREAQQPIGGQTGDHGTWLSGEHEDDELREEAAERARQAVRPERDRE